MKIYQTWGYNKANVERHITQWYPTFAEAICALSHLDQGTVGELEIKHHPSKVEIVDLMNGKNMGSGEIKIIAETDEEGAILTNL